MLFLPFFHHFFYSHGYEGMIVQSHAVSGISTRNELANPFPRCKKQRKTKSLVSSGVSLRKGRGGGLKSLFGRNNRSKKEFKKIAGCIHIHMNN